MHIISPLARVVGCVHREAEECVHVRAIYIYMMILHLLGHYSTYMYLSDARRAPHLHVRRTIRRR